MYKKTLTRRNDKYKAHAVPFYGFCPAKRSVNNIPIASWKQDCRLLDCLVFKYDPSDYSLEVTSRENRFEKARVFGVIANQTYCPILYLEYPGAML